MTVAAARLSEAANRFVGSCPPKDQEITVASMQAETVSSGDLAPRRA